MNYRMVLNTLAVVLRIEAALLVLPACVSLIYGEYGGAWSFALTVVIILAASLVSLLFKPKSKVIYAREGFVIVALAWALMSAFGALPFCISGEIPSYTDAFFETVSGFTTTGASILTDVEALSHGMAFWRSFTHWVGGMGVLVFVLMIMPLAGDRSIHIMRAEVPGPTKSKLMPKLGHSAAILYVMYIALTVIEVIFLLCGGMSLFDSLVHAFGTAGTGGFSIKSTSIAYYDSAYIDAVITVFMALFGINFGVFFLIITGRIKEALRSDELRWYIGIILVAITIVTVDILPMYGGDLLKALRFSSFQVSSIITTTGYVTANYDTWPMLSKTVLVLLMFIGACAGSTGGGMKVSRVMIYLRRAAHGIRGLVSPRETHAVTLDGKVLSERTLKTVDLYLIAYVFALSISVLLVSIDNFDFESTVTSVIACFNNVGPGLGICGATGNFAAFSDFSKYVLSADMLLGRLELFPMLMLFSVRVWKRGF